MTRCPYQRPEAESVDLGPIKYFCQNPLSNEPFKPEPGDGWEQDPE